jgi:enoyl-CoA hydratase/carnithine racemase
MTVDLAIDASGPIVRIELNRPDAANSMTLDMMRQLSAALARHGADPHASSMPDRESAAIAKRTPI